MSTHTSALLAAMATMIQGGKEMNNKPILDACCGGRMFYFDKDDPRVLFQDIREVETTLCDGRVFSVKPDVVADFTAMPYEDNTFKIVVFDPPHLKFSVSQKETKGWQMTKYGYLPAVGWKEMLSMGFKECFRVLKQEGVLIFKWNETDIKVSEILKLTPEKPVFGHISGKQQKTHWICFMKQTITQNQVNISDLKSKKYFELAKRRMSEETAQTSLF